MHSCRAGKFTNIDLLHIAHAHFSLNSFCLVIKTAVVLSGAAVRYALHFA